MYFKMFVPESLIVKVRPYVGRQLNLKQTYLKLICDKYFKNSVLKKVNNQSEFRDY